MSILSNLTDAVKTDGTHWTWGGSGFFQQDEETEKTCSTTIKVMDNVTTISAGRIRVWLSIMLCNRIYALQYCAMKVDKMLGWWLIWNGRDIRYLSVQRLLI